MEKVAEALGIPCYDSELLQKIAEESGFHVSYIQDAGEYAPGGFLASAFTHRDGGPNNADYLWKIQYRIISELARKGPCVIVGRCADYILRDKADCLRVFIHADMKFRAERIVKEYGKREDSPEQRLRDKDKRRAAYHRFYTDMKWGHATRQKCLGMLREERRYRMYDSAENPLNSISILYRKSHIWLNNSCAGHQLTAAQASVILILCDFGAMTQDEMTKCLSLDKSVIAKTVTKLEEQGFLIRETHAKDKRTYDIRPTRKALDVYPFIKDQVQECFEHMTHRMTEQEKAEFRRLLRLAAQASLGQEEENREEQP